jgi:alpha-N-arabinofuranosidase
VRLGDVLPDGELEATVLAGDSPEAYNDVEHPQRVVPVKGKITARRGALTLPPHSLTMARINTR